MHFRYDPHRRDRAKNVKGANILYGAGVPLIQSLVCRRMGIRNEQKPSIVAEWRWETLVVGAGMSWLGRVGYDRGVPIYERL